MFAGFSRGCIRDAAYAAFLATATFAAFMTNIQAEAAETLVIGQSGDALTLDPDANNGTVEASVMSNIFEGLVTFDRDMQIQPALATKWENPEPDRWLFHLRTGEKFHNGAPLTAEDVKY